MWRSNAGLYRAFIVFFHPPAAKRARKKGELSVLAFSDQLMLKVPDPGTEWPIFLRLWNEFHDRDETSDQSETTGTTSPTSSDNVNPEFHSPAEDYWSFPPISVLHNKGRTLQQQSYSMPNYSDIIHDQVPHPSTSSTSLASRIHQGTATFPAINASNFTSTPSSAPGQLISANVPSNLNDLSQGLISTPTNSTQPIFSTNTNDPQLTLPKPSSQSRRSATNPDVQSSIDVEGFNVKPANTQAEIGLIKERRRNEELQRSLE
jgi:hypothetical protein